MPIASPTGGVQPWRFAVRRGVAPASDVVSKVSGVWRLVWIKEHMFSASLTYYSDLMATQFEVVPIQV